MGIKDLTSLVVSSASPSMSYLGEQLKPFSRMPGGIFNRFRSMGSEGSAPSTVDAMLNNLENQQYNNPMTPRTEDMMPQQTAQFGGGSGDSSDGSSSEVLRQVNSSIARLTQITGKGNEINRAGFERLFGSMNASVRSLVDLKNLINSQQMLLQSFISEHASNNPSLNSRMDNKDANTVNMIDLLERIAIASEQHLLLDRLKSGLGEHGSIRKSNVRSAITRFDPYDTGSASKEEIYEQMLEETRKSNAALSDVRDSLKFKAFSATKGALKGIAKTPLKIVGGIWKYSTKRVIEEGATNIKAKMMAKREERESQAIKEYAEAVKNGDEQAKKAAKYKLKKAGVSDYITSKLDYGASASSVTMFKDRVSKRNESAVFDKEVRDTIVSGIPLLLSEIVKAINGSDVKYNYGTDSITDSETKMSTEVAMAKERVLDIQNRRSKMGFLRKDGAWKDYKDLDQARQNVENIELLQKNQNGKIDLFGKTIDSIHNEHNRSGVKSYKDMADFFWKTSGSLSIDQKIAQSAVNAFHKVNSAHNSIEDWIKSKYKKIKTGQDTYKDLQGIEDITTNPIDMVRLLRNNGVLPDDIDAEISEKFGNKRSSNPSLLSSIQNSSGSGITLDILEDNTYENNVLLKEIIEILNNWRWGNKGSGGPGGPGGKQGPGGPGGKQGPGGPGGKQGPGGPGGNNNQTQQNNDPWTILTNITKNSRQYKNPIGPMQLTKYQQFIADGGIKGWLSRKKDQLSGLNPLNKISGIYNNVKTSIGEKLQSLNPVSYFKNKFAAIKESKLKKAEEKSYKDIHSTNKSIHKIEKMMSRHYRWLRGKAFMDIIGGAISTGLGFLGNVLESITNTLSGATSVIGAIAGAIGLNKIKNLLTGGGKNPGGKNPGGKNPGGKPPGGGKIPGLGLLSLLLGTASFLNGASNNERIADRTGIDPSILKQIDPFRIPWESVSQGGWQIVEDLTFGLINADSAQNFFESGANFLSGNGWNTTKELREKYYLDVFNKKIDLRTLSDNDILLMHNLKSDKISDAQRKAVKIEYDRRQEEKKQKNNQQKQQMADLYYGGDVTQIPQYDPITGKKINRESKTGNPYLRITNKGFETNQSTPINIQDSYKKDYNRTIMGDLGLTINQSTPTTSNSKRSEQASDLITKNAKPSSTGYCAAHVREGLESAGFNILGKRPGSAYMYGDGVLQRMGFQELNVDPLNYKPKKGDISITMPFNNHPHGHIAMYNSKNWVSDFVQKSIVVHKDFPYNNANNQIRIFRNTKSGDSPKTESKGIEKSNKINEAKDTQTQETKQSKTPKTPKTTSGKLNKDIKEAKDKAKDKANVKGKKIEQTTKQKQPSPASSANAVVLKKINADNKEVDYKTLDLTKSDVVMEQMKRIDNMNITDINAKHKLLAVLESNMIDQYLTKYKNDKDPTTFTKIIEKIQSTRYLSEELKAKYMEKLQSTFPDFSMTGLDLKSFNKVNHFRENFDRVSKVVKSDVTGEQFNVKAFKNSLSMKFASVGKVEFRLDYSDEETYKNAVKEVLNSNMSEEQKKKEIEKINLKRIITFMKKYKTIDNDKDYEDLKNMILNSNISNPETRTELMKYLQDMDARNPMKDLSTTKPKMLKSKQYLSTSDSKLKVNSSFDLTDDKTFQSEKERILKKIEVESGYDKNYKIIAENSSEMKKLYATRMLQKINSYKTIDKREDLDALDEELITYGFDKETADSIYATMADKVTFDDKVKFKYGTFEYDKGNKGKSYTIGNTKLFGGNINWNDEETVKAVRARNPHLTDEYIEQRKFLYNIADKIKKAEESGDVEGLRKLNNEIQNNKFVDESTKKSLSDDITKKMSKFSIIQKGISGGKYKQLATTKGFTYYDPVADRFTHTTKDLTDDKAYNEHLKMMEQQMYSYDDQKIVGDIQNARLQQLLTYRYNNTLSDEQFTAFNSEIENSKYLSDKERKYLKIQSILKKSNFSGNDTNAIIDILKDSNEFTEEEKEKIIARAKYLYKKSEENFAENKNKKPTNGKLSKEQIIEMVKNSDPSWFKNKFKTSGEFVAELANEMSGSDTNLTNDFSGGLFNIGYEEQEKAYNANKDLYNSAFKGKKFNFKDGQSQVFTGLVYIDSIKNDLKKKYPKLRDEDFTVKMIKAVIEKDDKTLQEELERVSIMKQIEEGYGLKREEITKPMIDAIRLNNGKGLPELVAQSKIQQNGSSNATIAADSNPSNIVSSAVASQQYSDNAQSGNNTTNNNNKSVTTENNTVINNVYYVDKSGKIQQVSSDKNTSSNTQTSSAPINPDIYAAANS